MGRCLRLYERTKVFSRMQRACEMVQSLLKTQAALQRTPYHPFCAQILHLLQKEGLIRGFNVEGNKITVLLKHYQGAPVIRNIRVVSKPSREMWLLPHELKFRTRYNTGLWVMQTPVGVISHRDCIEMGIGGKMLFAVNKAGSTSAEPGSTRSLFG